MNRNVERVGVGVGAFHNPPRAKYSEETRDLIKLLMEESKLSMMQRKSIQRAVDRGDSLPPPAPSSSSFPSRSRQRTPDPKESTQVTFPCYWKKRSQNTIANSGAYDREQYRRTSPLPDKERQKRHLACIMAYGRDMPPTSRGPKIVHEKQNEAAADTSNDPLDHLIRGIRERIEFLSDMENLGQGKKYRPTIHQEIAQKIRAIESIDSNHKSNEIIEELKNYKYQLPPPKPFPMGELEDS
ncbi:UPF0193 protein EVG1 homolog isoform X1 [Venturia canescens]|uniref:UPF0193 protein EVG1 homolog isoform X1 n=1 Tax=Venturia canescens TaxID=32260 RepID=UPI001C9D4102|nr:UPF0193 protein EVG1 homolog isoform X1 [Venturia canescens]